jgi:uncharacterized protein (TIGR02594 family)
VEHDSVPWCAAFVGAMLKRAGIAPSGSLAARSYLDRGKAVALPKPGCIVVLARAGSSAPGHVAFFDRDDGGRLFCLGGNQSDSVGFASYPARSLLGLR